jgi:hypothetical protein
MPARANIFHRVMYKSIQGTFSYINQLTDSHPFGMNGSLSSGPSASVMIAAYYGCLNKQTDNSPSGYGTYLCNPYEMKGYTFSETSPDPDGKSFAGAHGFHVKDKRVDVPPEIPSDYLRSHGLLTTYVDPKISRNDLLTTIHQEIDKNQPIYLQYKEHNVVITGYGYSTDQKDILLVKDPSNPIVQSVYLSQIEPSYLLLTKTISFAENVKVVNPEIEIHEKPIQDSKVLATKKKDVAGVVKLHRDYSDLWVNNYLNSILQAWYYIEWEDGTKGWSSPGKGLINYFEPYIKVKEDPEKNKVTLTLTIHEETLTGPIVTGAQVFATDSKAKTFQQSSNNYGYVILKGEKGKWSFKITKLNFYDKNWNETIDQNQSLDVFILKKPKTEEDLKKPNLICNEIRLRSGTAEEGKEYFINPSVQNIGKSPAESRSHVKVYLSPKNDTNLTDDYLLGEAEVSTLKIGEKCIATVFFRQFPAVPVKVGIDFLMWPVIIVDSQNEVDEVDENNTYIAKTPIRILLQRKRGADSPCDRAPRGIPILKSPAYMKVDGERITFKWTLVRCASYYYLTLWDMHNTQLYEIGPLDGPAYTLEIPLDSGQTYYWGITPYNQHGFGPMSIKVRFETE